MEVRCVRCNRKNRLPREPRADGDYQCGHCGGVLAVPAGAYGDEDLAPMSKWKKIGILAGLWFVIFIVVLTFNFFRPGRAKIFYPDQPYTRPPAAYLPNGTDIVPPARLVGEGKIRLTNRTVQDASAKLQKLAANGTSVLVRFVYIRRGEAVTLDNLPAGSYVLFFALGTDWDSRTQSFTRDVSHYSYNSNLRLDPGGPPYDLEIGPPPLEGMKTSWIPPADFHRGQTGD